MAKNFINKTLKRWKRYHQISEVGDITRRYFVMNAFDGALTMLGVVIGAYVAGILNPAPILKIPKSLPTIACRSVLSGFKVHLSI